MSFGKRERCLMPSLRKAAVHALALAFIVHVLLIIPKGMSYPVASFTHSPSAPASGEIVTFDASASSDSDGTIVSYEWSFGDGSYGNGKIATHAYESEGTYNVTLKVTSDKGFFSSTSHTLEVYLHDVAIINAILPAAEIYQGQVVNIIVIARNEGTAVETFNVTLYPPDGPRQTQQVAELHPNMDAVLAFSWNTTNVIPDVGYVFRVKADVVSWEKDTSDNTYFTDALIVKPQVAQPTNPLLTFVNLIFPYAVSLALIFSLVGGIAWRKHKIGPAPVGFEFFNEMTRGGIPDSYSVMISGDAGSGKSVLCQQLASMHLQQGKPCIYVTYDSFPDEVRESMKNLQLDISTFEKGGTFKFVDCYSGVAGKKSSEKYSVEQPYSLSDLGITMSIALNEVKQKSTRVFLDSTTPLFMRLNPSEVMEFLQDRIAKIKGDDGTFLFTIGKQTVSPAIMSSLEDIVDCIIELVTQRGDGKTSRNFRIKRFRGRGFVDAWVPFKIDSRKGFLFFPSKKRIKSEQSQKKSAVNAS